MKKIIINIVVLTAFILWVAYLSYRTGESQGRNKSLYMEVFQRGYLLGTLGRVHQKDNWKKDSTEMAMILNKHFK